MKVNEFAKRLGLPASKVRYYDRIGLISGKRIEENNYRDFTDLDAFNLYHATMLRSFDMSVDEAKEAQTKGLHQIDEWVDLHALELEEQLRLQAARLVRLKEMQAYFAMIREQGASLKVHELDDSYNLFNFGKDVNPSGDIVKTIELLAEQMPFSYVAVKVSKESIESDREYLDVSIGLGILKRNQQLLQLKIPSSIPMDKGGPILQIVIETADPFKLTKADVQPLLDELNRRQGGLKSDLLGRLYISYQKDGQFVHGIGLSAELVREN